MKKAWIDYGRKQNYISNTLIQCYHAENILLLTPLAKYDFALLKIPWKNFIKILFGSRLDYLQYRRIYPI